MVNFKPIENSEQKRKINFRPINFRPIDEESDNISVGKTISNIPSSGIKYTKDLASGIKDIVTSPLETISGIAKIGGGAISKLSPGEAIKKGDIESEQAFDAVKNMVKERYGSIENLKKTIQNDPVGFVADFATVLTGIGGTVAKAGEISKASQLAKVGRIVGKSSEYIDPLLASTKAVSGLARNTGSLGATLLGVTTGVAGDVIREAYRYPTKAFKDAMRGVTKGEDILNVAKNALNDFKDNTRNEYISKLKKIKEFNKELDISPIKNKLNQKLADWKVGIGEDGTLDFSRSALRTDIAAQDAVRTATDMITDWGSKAEDLKPEYVDILKQNLNDLYSPSSRARAFTESLAEETRKILENNVPGFKEMTGPYNESNKLIREIEKAFSLKDQASMDTAITKLTQGMKNKEFKTALLNRLEQATGTELTQQISGMALKPKTPQGFIGQGALGGGIIGSLSGIVSPQTLFALAITSPRIVGEFVSALGYPHRVTDMIIKRISAVRELKKVPQVGFQVGRAQRVIEEEKKKKGIPELIEQRQYQ